jgi:hypothetical protein
MLRKIALATLMMFGLSAAVRADIVIDTFTDAATVNYQINLSNGNPLTLTPVLLPSGFGRTTYIEVVSPTPPNFNSVSGSIGGGTFSVDTNNSSQVFATLTYAGIGDFSGGTGIRLDFVNLNPGNTSTTVALDMPISVAISTGTGTLTSTVNVAGSGAPFPVNLPFASFTGTGNLADVTGLAITLNSGGPNGRIASDFVLDNVVIPTNAVPAPPALVLAVAAAPMLLVRRWAARKSA